MNECWNLNDHELGSNISHLGGRKVLELFFDEKKLPVLVASEILMENSSRGVLFSFLHIRLNKTDIFHVADIPKGAYSEGRRNGNSVSYENNCLRYLDYEDFMNHVYPCNLSLYYIPSPTPVPVYPTKMKEAKPKQNRSKTETTK